MVDFIDDGSSNVVVVVDYSPEWPEEFNRLRDRAKAAVGDLAVKIEHIGSTAVPGLKSKPTIDMTVVIRSDADRPETTRRLETVGYKVEGDLGIYGQDAFRWPTGDQRHHLYVTTEDNAHFRNQVRFRDQLRTDPALAADYAALKVDLAERFRHDRQNYSEAKTAFIRAAQRVDPV